MALQLEDPADRPKTLPTAYPSLRAVPMYEHFIQVRPLLQSAGMLGLIDVLIRVVGAAGEQRVVRQLFKWAGTGLACRMFLCCTEGIMLSVASNVPRCIPVPFPPTVRPACFSAATSHLLFYRISNLTSAPLQERFERCLDLYLCPRVRRKRMHIDPQSLVPKLPKPRDLQPFPTTLCQRYLGHTGKVRRQGALTGSVADNERGVLPARAAAALRDKRAAACEIKEHNVAWMFSGFRLSLAVYQGLAGWLTLRASPPPPPAQVRSLSTDASGQWLASGGDDGTLRLWEVRGLLGASYRHSLLCVHRDALFPVISAYCRLCKVVIDDSGTLHVREYARTPSRLYRCATQLRAGRCMHRWGLARRVLRLYPATCVLNPASQSPQVSRRFHRRLHCRFAPDAACAAGPWAAPSPAWPGAPTRRCESCPPPSSPSWCCCGAARAGRRARGRPARRSRWVAALAFAFCRLMFTHVLRCIYCCLTALGGALPAWHSVSFPHILYCIALAFVAYQQ